MRSIVIDEREFERPCCDMTPFVERRKVRAEKVSRSQRTYLQRRGACRSDCSMTERWVPNFGAHNEEFSGAEYLEP